MELPEFLLARIAEDEAVARRHQSEVGHPGWWLRPSRILAECDAKRRIVEVCEANQDEDSSTQFVAYETFRLLALPYADHPDYRQEWRP